jgi:hypothetical protein
MEIGLVILEGIALAVVVVGALAVVFDKPPLIVVTSGA